MSVFFFKPRRLWAVQWAEGGKKKRQYFKTEQEALTRDEELSAARNSPDDRMTLGELTVAFFRSHPDYHAKTKDTIITALGGRDKDGKHIEGAAEFMREKYADTLSRRDLELLRQALRDRGNKNTSINKYQAYIRAILAWGADQELISRNPWRDFKRLPVARKEITTTLSDVKLVFAQAPEWLQWAIITMYSLTMRAGHVELFGLLWTAFDWRRGIVRIRQGKSGRIKTVYPPHQYMELAYERYKEDMTAGIPWVCHRAGKRVLDYRTAWDKAVKDAGIPHLPMTNIRHVSVSEMLARTGDLAAVAAQAGHSNPSTTGTFYAHVMPEGQKRAAMLLPEITEEGGENE